MQIIVLGDEVSREEFMAKQINPEIKVTFVNNVPFPINKGIKHNSTDAFFLLENEINLQDINAFEGKPVFINSTVNTLKEHNLPANFSRVNGWPTFLNRGVWEIASRDANAVKNIFEKLEWKYIIVADEPGLVSARIISMIINEAYFALGEDVSTKDEIDIAMKLGTNYPHGPFEWSKKIGLKKIYSLLKKLSETDSRYMIAPAIKNELASNY